MHLKRFTGLFFFLIRNHAELPLCLHAHTFKGTQFSKSMSQEVQTCQYKIIIFTLHHFGHMMLWYGLQ